LDGTVAATETQAMNLSLSSRSGSEFNDVKLPQLYSKR
jgi:hypothetical protein